MRALPISVFTGSKGWKQGRAAFCSNWRYYLMEALGLGIFMISACGFTALLESSQGAWHQAIPHAQWRMLIMGLLMGATALFIFYSPLTAASGAQINPAVTLAFWRAGRMCHWDSLFYILFQFAGGLGAVCLMKVLLGHSLSDSPVRCVVTVPGPSGTWAAAAMEFGIAFFTMLVVLITSSSRQLEKYTRPLAGLLVCLWVLLAGPVSGFGMNPARSLASAWPAGVWTDIWIYLLIPVLAMWAAVECVMPWLMTQKHSFTGTDTVSTNKKY